MFEAKGDVAEWRLIYDHAVLLAVGDTITYEELDTLLDRDFRASRSPIYTAMERLEDDEHRTFITARGVGYRIAAAGEHEGLARAHHRRSRRQLRKAVGKASSADRSALSQEDRQRIDGLEMSLRQQQDMIARLDVRTARQEKELRKLRRDTSATVAEVDGKVDKLTELLARHGIGLEVEAE